MSSRLSRRDLDCIETVHSLSSEGWPARVKDIAGVMGVAPPTAVQFLGKLLGLGLLEKRPNGYRLSKRGEECFAESIRAHRLIETLLVRNGLALEEACRVSSSMTEPMDNIDLEKLCAHMSHPAKCPHGRPIPEGARHA